VQCTENLAEIGIDIPASGNFDPPEITCHPLGGFLYDVDMQIRRRGNLYRLTLSYQNGDKYPIWSCDSVPATLCDKLGY